MRSSVPAVRGVLSLALPSSPDIITEVAFASGPMDDPQVYSDVSALLRSWSFRYGRRGERASSDPGLAALAFADDEGAVDPDNTASPYWPNVLPGRRVRARAERWSEAVADLTVSGTPITDALRALGVQGDGLSADSSFGLWEAATNLVTNGGFETNATGWVASVGGAIARDTAEAKFGAASGRINTTGAAGNEGAYDEIALTSGQTYTFSVWLKCASANQLRLWIRTTGGVNKAEVAFTPTGSWQRVTLTWTADATATFWFQVGNKTATAETIYVDGVQVENQPLATPYIHTDGASASRTAARVQAPAALLDETQGWVAMRVRFGGNLAESRYGWAWRDDNNNQMYVRWNFSLSRWEMFRTSGGTPGTAVKADTVAVGDMLTLIGRWTATQLGISVDGAAFATAAQSAVPTLAATAFDIGGLAGSGTELDGDVLWFACGTGTLTDADAAAIHAFGNTDPTWEDIDDITLAAQVTAVWPADTAAYTTPADAVIFQTFVDPEQGWQRTWDKPSHAEVQVQTLDAFDQLNNTIPPVGTDLVQQLTGARINALLNLAGWPAADRAIDAGQWQIAAAADVTSSYLDLIRQAEQTERGHFFINPQGVAVFHDRHYRLLNYEVQATFSDAQNWQAGFHLYETLVPAQSKIVNDWRISREGGTLQTGEDAVSIAAYGPRTGTLTTQGTSDVEMENLVGYELARTKDPYRRFEELAFKLGNDRELWKLWLRLEIGDVVTVLATPPGTAEIVEQNCYIEAKELQWGPGARSSAKLRLSPAESDSFWVVGDPALSLAGNTTRTGI